MLVALGAALLLTSPAELRSRSAPVHEGWELASSASLGGAGGTQISSGAAGHGNWTKLASFPATVLAGLTEAGEYPELFYGQNLKAVQTARFDVPWWYRTSLPAVAMDAAKSGGLTLLTFEGLNYRANIWVNGKLLATKGSIAGAYRYFDVDISAALATGAGATVAVEVFRSYDWGVDCQQEHGNDTPPMNLQVSCRGRNKSASQDLGITWVDWAPAPHDANLGLWRDVLLTTVPAGLPPVTVRYPGLETALSKDNTAAHVTITAEVTNWGTATLSGSVHAALGALGSAEWAAAHLPGTSPGKPGSHVQAVLNISLAGLSPAKDLWWPWQMGAPNRHNLTMSFAEARAARLREPRLQVSTTVPVGLRSASNVLDGNHNAIFRVNGKRILIRGGGYAPDLLLRMTQ